MKYTIYARKKFQKCNSNKLFTMLKVKITLLYFTAVSIVSYIVTYVFGFWQKKYQLQRMSLISRQMSFNVHINFSYDLHVQIFYIYNFSLLFLKNLSTVVCQQHFVPTRYIFTAYIIPVRSVWSVSLISKITCYKTINISIKYLPQVFMSRMFFYGQITFRNAYL